MSEDFEPLVEAARGGDEHAFRALVEPLGRELHAYAYRMLGGFHDADDALQESRLKAWRALATYAPRGSFRAWMYRIVTNTCLDLLKVRSRRVLPQDVSPSIAPGPPTTAPRADILWLEPYPDALLPGGSMRSRSRIRRSTSARSRTRRSPKRARSGSRRWSRSCATAEPRDRFAPSAGAWGTARSLSSLTTRNESVT